MVGEEAVAAVLAHINASGAKVVAAKDVKAALNSMA